MCASYWIKRFDAEWAEMIAWLALDVETFKWTNSEFKKRGEAYSFPGYEVPVVTWVDGQRTLSEFRWGFLPPWATSATHKPAPFNARSETVATSGLFKSAFRKQRCFIPANGFYEWREEDGKKKRYLFTPTDRPGLAFAGIWSNWQGLLRTCTILTTNPNPSVEPYHDRMPVLLNEQGMVDWLNPATPESTLNSLLVPADCELTAQAI